MFLEQISLENYRNYTSLDISLSNDVNIFYGNNGQGKTNLLEAIFFAVIGKSFRNTKDADIIKQEKDSFAIHLKIRDDITDQIDIKYNKSKEKYIKVNGFYLRKTGQLMGSLLAVIFSPEDMNLVSEGPSVRRKFMDIAISQMESLYYFDLLKYNKILNQKNNLLRKIKYNNIKDDKNVLSVWNEQLSETGARIIKRRTSFIKKLAVIAEEKHRNIAENSAGKEELLTMMYHPDIPREITETDDDKVIKEALYQLYETKKNREIEREMTLFGPHRDDIDFKLNENDLKKFGSQGQKRTAVLSLKIAELRLLEEQTGRKPLFLLDDVFSELDLLRQASFLHEIGKIQTFISCVNTEFLQLEHNDAAFFEIKNGSVVL